VEKEKATNASASPCLRVKRIGNLHNEGGWNIRTEPNKPSLFGKTAEIMSESHPECGLLNYSAAENPTTAAMKKQERRVPR
jgi:hypothetical protein